MADPSTALALQAVAWVVIIPAISYWLGYLRGKIAGLKVARELLDHMQDTARKAQATHERSGHG